MGNKNKRNSDNDELSTSYREGVGRIIGIQKPMLFEIPPETIQRRQKYWDDLFVKYSEELPNEIVLDITTLKPYKPKCKPEAVCKSKNTIQYWINTGYLPYQPSVREIYGLKNDLSRIEREQDTSYTESSGDESSVDTAAYILSNVNTTNKEETMAIVKGAKHNSNQQHSPISSKTTTLLNNTKSGCMEQNCSEESALTNDTKMKQRKKLYTGRDSPVDLVTMNQSSREVLCKLNHNVHPALDDKSPLQKRVKVHKKRNIRRLCVLNKKLLKSSFLPNYEEPEEIENSQNYFNRLFLKLNSCKENDDVLETDPKSLNASTETENLNKCNGEQPVDVSIQCVNENSKLTAPKFVRRKHRRNNSKKFNKCNMFEKLKRSNPMVQLTRVSEAKTARCAKKANKLMKVGKNMHPVVRLTKLSSPDIRKYTELKNRSLRLNPTVYLMKLSEYEIQKYKRSNNVAKDANLCSETSFKKLCLNNNNEFPLRTSFSGSQSSVNIINVMSNDTDSDETTVLMYELSSASNASVIYKNTFKSNSFRVETRNRNSSMTKERSRNSISKKDESSKQNPVGELNTPNSLINDRYNDKLHIGSDKRIKLNIVVCSDTESETENLRNKRKSKEKNNATRSRNVTGKAIPEKPYVIRSTRKSKELQDVKVNNSCSKHIVNYLHFETKLYDSSSDSDSF